VAPIRLLWASVVLGGLAQSLSGSAGGLLAEEVAGSVRVAGLPQTLLVLGGAGAALAMSGVARRRGRAVALALGAVVAAAGCGIVVAGRLLDSLAGILLGTLVTGAGGSAVMLARYAAVDLQPGRPRARAIATVLTATTIGAVAGPNLLGPSASVADRLDAPVLLGAYVVAGVVFLVAAGVVLRVRPSLPPTELATEPTAGLPSPARRSLAVDPDGMTGGIVLAAANLVMVAVMTMAPLHLHHGGTGLTVIGVVVSLHIAGMFAPSPASGWLTERIGGRRTAVVAFGVLTTASVGAATAGTGTVPLGGALLLLGVGWNLALVAGSDLLIRDVPLQRRPGRESWGEVGMASAAAVGGLASGLVVAAFDYATLGLLGAVTSAVLMGALLSDIFRAAAAPCRSSAVRCPRIRGGRRGRGRVGRRGG
jgi:MFS family permease